MSLDNSEVESLNNLKTLLLKCDPQLQLLVNDNNRLTRFLKARNWDVSSAHKLIEKDVEWRQNVKPHLIDCDACHKIPGNHSMRQIGFDLLGRPVLFTSFHQPVSQGNIIQESVNHMIYTFENAIRSMQNNVTQWVIIIDCAGMSSANCNPRMGYECTKIMSSHYPERLGLAICIGPGQIFKIAWKAIRKLLPETTTSKIILVKDKTKMQSTFEAHFAPDLCKWLLIEVAFNRTDPSYVRMRPFWLSPSNSEDAHDPRGVNAYTKHWIVLNHSFGHMPHPTIVDVLLGILNSSQVGASTTVKKADEKFELVVNDEAFDENDVHSFNDQQGDNVIDDDLDDACKNYNVNLSSK